MADILIHGISIPRERDHLTITINVDGTVQPLVDMYCPIIAHAIELPEHGDLIDKQATFKALSEKFKSSDGFVSWTDAIDIVLRAQEIVPSNKEDAE